MGKRNLFFGVILGAVAGGLISLFSSDARYYTKGKMKNVRKQSNYYVQHPSEAVRNVRDAFNKFNRDFSSGAESAINALEQVEDTLDKFTKKGQKNLDDTM
ncbi:YtxH domain-containing protein [Virgibacillus doumboii]|uniref:YtxH domain-containing protein n=1 Tax=Virgibacillus doumboii TaxID=2697503 RepID=UPI0013DFCDC6|nr:YtxH domain-containing protein [Virgibacillus doumboii]